MPKWLHAWLSNLAPNRDAHNERVKLFALTLNAIGLAALVGGVIAPIVDPSRHQGPLAAVLGASVWLAFLVAAFQLLGYIKGKD